MKALSLINLWHSTIESVKRCDPSIYHLFNIEGKDIWD